MSYGSATGESDAGLKHDPIARLGPWFHNLHLPDGRQTRPDHPYGDFPSFKWQQLGPHIPDDLSGKRALDIGCNAGFYTFELAKRGAEVLGVDIDDHYLDQARWAARELGLESRVTFEQRTVYSLFHVAEQFDLVLFMGVLYHLRYPLLGLDVVSRLVRPQGNLIFQALTMPGEESIEPPEDAEFLDRDYMRRAGWPKMAFIEKRLDGDPTNWWAPNHACVEAMLRTCGFTIRQRPGHEIYVCTPDHPRDEVMVGIVDDELKQVYEEVP